MEFLVTGIILSVILITVLFFKFQKLISKINALEFTRQLKEPVKINLDLKPLERLIEQIPNKTLQSITSSTNGMKGATGELIGYLKLGAEYDKVIPLGDIVDFLGVSFPKDGKSGSITFIDIKTGKAKLSNDQRKLRDIIKLKNINFVKYHISLANQIEKDSTDE
jgi:predicted Holliday junction resolvase-like endonuclease